VGTTTITRVAKTTLPPLPPGIYAIRVVVVVKDLSDDDGDDGDDGNDDDDDDNTDNNTDDDQGGDDCEDADNDNGDDSDDDQLHISSGIIAMNDPIAINIIIIVMIIEIILFIVVVVVVIIIIIIGSAPLHLRAYYVRWFRSFTDGETYWYIQQCVWFYYTLYTSAYSIWHHSPSTVLPGSRAYRSAWYKVLVPGTVQEVTSVLISDVFVQQNDIFAWHVSPVSYQVL